MCATDDSGLVAPGGSAGQITTCPRRSIKEKALDYQGFSNKRLKGLEPSTFCMASRRSSQLSYSRGAVEYNPAQCTAQVTRPCSCAWGEKRISTTFVAFGSE